MIYLLTPEFAQTMLWLGLLLIGLEVLVFTVGILGVLGVGMVLLATIALQAGEAINLLSPDTPIVMFLYLVLFLTFAAIAILIIIAMRKAVETGTEALLLHHAHITEWNGIQGRVWVEGESWRARSHHEHHYKVDDEVVITEVDNLTLWIEPTGATK